MGKETPWCVSFSSDMLLWLSAGMAVFSENEGSSPAGCGPEIPGGAK
jgi:hypothetical protein